MPELPRRRVALLVETSHGSGREILKGIARFSRQNANWQLFHGASGLTEQIPEWLDEWEGDAVIARIQNEETREKLEKILHWKTEKSSIRKRQTLNPLKTVNP